MGHFDLVIYSHFLTTPWNPERYLYKLERFKKHGFNGARKVAFFQDEYFSIDLRNRFIRELGIERIYSVAPESEWKKLYGDSGVDSKDIRACLTAYVDQADVNYIQVRDRGLDRPIDIGYRTGSPRSDMYRLGEFGTLKFLIGDKIQAFRNRLKLDVMIGPGFLNGRKWFGFLLKCKYVLGVESGAGLLDPDGSINEKINRYMKDRPGAPFAEVSRNCFEGLDGNLNLKAISPRVFEAAMTRTCMILVEGEYSGVLKPERNYIAVRKDFSNLEEVVRQVENDSTRRAIVTNTYADLIKSGRYNYENFIQSFFTDLPVDSNENPTFRASERLAYALSCLTDFMGWSLMAARSLVLSLKKRMD